MPLTPPLLPIGRYRFELRLDDPVRLPPYPGSTWRGLLGHALRRSACVTRQPDCNGCLLSNSCAYSTLFETPAPDRSETGYRQRPHPFVLVTAPDPVEQHAVGETLQPGINLFGGGNSALAYLVHAFANAGERGLTRSRSRFRLTAVEQQAIDRSWHTIHRPGGGIDPLAPVHPPPPACPTTTRLSLVTPLRLKRRGDLIGPREFRASDLVERLARRIDELHRYHAPQPAQNPLRLDSEGLTVIDAELRWQDWTRYSSRQKAALQMGGLMGHITLGGSGLAALWPWLWLGQYTHLGKGTSLGLGRYRLTPLD